MSKMDNWNNKEQMETSSDEEENFDSLIEKLRRSRKKETRHSEEKVTHLETLLQQQKSEIEDLRKTVKVLKSQEFHRKAKYEETSSAPSLTSSEESESESDFDDEGIDTAHTNTHSYAEPSHPLLVDLVLETIMKYLPLKSILASRLVCRKWNKFAHPHIVVKSDRVILEVHQPWTPSKGNKLSKFLEVMRSPIDICPVSKYVLRNFEHFTELEEFFRRFGPTIKSLDLSFPTSFDDNGNLRRVLFEYAPFVEHLRIECCSILESEHFWEYSAFEVPTNKLVYLKTLYIANIRGSITLNKEWIKEFLLMTPNLKKLILQVNFKDNGHEFIQTVLDTLLEVGNLDKMKFLFISSVTEQNFQTLIQLACKGLQLKTLKFQDICLHSGMHLQDDQIQPETISKFLRSQCDSLEHLKIDQRSNRIKGFIFPRMGSLKTLQLISYDELDCGTLNYVELFPNLESLTLRGCEVFALEKYFSPQMNPKYAGLNVKKLSLPSGIRDEEFPLFLEKMFPNVTELEIRGASNEYLWSVWRSWPKLEILKLVLSHFDGSLDPGITGIEPDVCSRIRASQDYTNVDLDSIKTHPGLSDLNELKELQIECRSIWIPCNIITDVSGYLAFAQMKQLKSFIFTEIGVPEQFDLSDKCIKTIHENLTNAEISFKIISDHGRWRLELEEDEAASNMYETEPLLEDHNKDKTFYFEKNNAHGN